MELTLLSYGDAGWGDEMLRGSVMTLALAVSAFATALLFSLIFVPVKLSRFAAVRFVGAMYTTVFRGIPELLVIYLVFFGGGVLLASIANGLFGYEGYVNLPIFVTGMLCIGISSGAYCTEVIRGAVLAVPKSQFEAADAIGLSQLDKFRFILLPQIVRIALPGLGNIWQITLKETSLISVIGLVEIMRQASIASGATREPFTFYSIAAVLFLVLTSLSNRGFARAEIWANRGMER